MVVQHGQITVTSAGQRIVYRAGADGKFGASYWDATESSSAELVVNGGGLFVAGSDGVVDSRSPGLVVTNITPNNGTRLGAGDSIRVQLNNLINTDANHLHNAITLSGGDGVPLAADQYTPTGINTLAGGYVDIGVVGILLRTIELKLM